MKLESISFTHPERKITNADVIDKISVHSSWESEVTRKKVLSTVERLLQNSGARDRYWISDGERPIELVEKAVHSCLHDSSVGLSDIGAVIYAGVDRGFGEPASAYFVAEAVGLTEVQCFDVMDACNGWLRALYLAKAMYSMGFSKSVLVVNSEFNQFPGGAVSPKSYSINNQVDVKRRFPGLTVGEGVTATLLSPGECDDWFFSFTSRPDLAELCVVPFCGYERYLKNSSSKIGNFDLNSFQADGARMKAAAEIEIKKLLKAVGALADIKLIITHANSEKDWGKLRDHFANKTEVYNIFSRYGNLVSASMPAAISRKLQKNQISRGDSVLCVGASGGMSFSCCKIPI